MLAARVLSDHFEDVIIVEPDTELYDKRTRTAQWNQPHGLPSPLFCSLDTLFINCKTAFLPVILAVLRRLLTNCDEELEKAGLSVAIQTVNMQHDGRRILTPSGKMVETILGSRMGCVLF
jgi:hypothetical protein